jgi:hypothetical protein
MPAEVVIPKVQLRPLEIFLFMNDNPPFNRIEMLI